jgi:nucleoid-associated protein YgaU
MNKNSIWVLVGLAIVAVAAVAGLTRDRWIAGAPQTAAIAVPPQPSGETQVQQQAAQPEQPAAQPEQPAAQPEQPAAQPEQQAAVQPEQPAAQPEQQVAVQPEQPAAQPEQQVAVQPEQPAAQPEQQAAAQPEQQVAVQPEQPAAQPEQQVAVQPEQPAAQPEQQAAAQPEQQVAVQPEQPAAPKPQVPAFDTVRVEKTGDAVIAGTAEAGSEVVVKLDGQTIGKTTANNDGAFVVVPEQPLPPGSGELTIEATGKGDLQPVASEQSVAVIVPAGAKQDALVAVVSPDAPTRVLQKPEPAPAPEVAAAQPGTGAAEQPAPKTPAAAPARIVSIDAVDYDSSGNIIFSGQGPDGHTARIYVDNAFLGDAPVDAGGRWSYAGSAAITPGVHRLRVDGLDASGKVLNRIEVPFFREAQSKVAVAAAEQPAGQAGTQAEVPAAPGAGEQPAPQPPAGQAAQSAVREGRVVIQPGNNLWRISRVLYGRGEKYTVLYEANRDQIRDPDLIYPGQVFRTPDVAPKIETIDPKRRDPLTPEENAAAGN